MILTEKQLATAAPIAHRAGRVSGWHPHVAAALAEFQIDTVEAIAGAVANFLTETGEFSAIVENMNYSADRLMEVWPSRFPTRTFALGYAHNPERLANFIYGNRGGNRGEASGDGWLYRGRGLIGVTFRPNYLRCLNGLGRDASDVAYLETKEGAARSGAWFWRHGVINSRTGYEIDLNDLAARGDFQTACYYINGQNPPLGWQERSHYFSVLQEALSSQISDYFVEPKPATPRAMRMGYCGDDVTALQALLFRCGYEMPRSMRPDGSFDGSFGRETAQAVIDFQVKEGLLADAIAGPITMSRLRERAKERAS